MFIGCVTGSRILHHFYPEQQEIGLKRALATAFFIAVAIPLYEKYYLKSK
jgi:hypothetical protein